VSPFWRFEDSFGAASKSNSIFLNFPVGKKVLGRSFVHDCALIDDVSAVRYAERDLHILLYQENRSFPARGNLEKYSNISSTSTGMMPSEGSSSITIDGPAVMARAIASICCSRQTTSRLPA